MASPVDEAIARELEVLAPAENADGADWGEVRRRAGLPVAGGAPARRGGRALLVLIALLLTAGAAVPALALTADLRELLGLSQGQPEPVLENASLLVEAPADRGEVARLYEAPSSTGGTCWFVERVPVGSPRRATEDDGGGMCLSEEPGRPGAPMSWSLAMQPKTRNNVRGWRAPLLHGSINPELGATRVVLEWTGGVRRLPFANDHFLFVSEALYEPPERKLPFELVAYDEAGRTVARAKLPKTALYTG